ncbi:hypothetical protein B0H13DRAFT_1871912 [Mycena leptocephala]|nr:hypothetical protein B0H13DRAFT_1871912 [Mycena leptocephala]
MTIVEAMAQLAMEKSPAQTVRDDRALVWTVKSLANDAELQSFVETIPDVLWGPDRRRHAYAAHIERLLNNPELSLAARIENFLRSCDSGLLSIEDSRRRRIICFKAMWAIASLSGVSESRTHPTSRVSHFSWGPIHRFMFDAQHDTRPYAISVHALLQWSVFCDMTYGLAQYQANINGNAIQDWVAIEKGGVSGLLGVTDKIETFFWKTNIDILGQSLMKSVGGAARFDLAAREFRGVLSRLIFFDYLALSGRYLNSVPYQWEKTLNMIRPTDSESAPFSDIVMPLERALDEVIFSHQVEFDSMKNMDWVDTITHNLFKYWQPDEPRRIPSAIIRYLNARKDDDALQGFFRETGRNNYLWSSLPTTLSSVQNADEIMTATWRTTSLGWGPVVSLYDSLIQALERVEPSPTTFSVIVMVKARVLFGLLYGNEPGIFPLRHAVLPTETSIDIPSDLLDAPSIPETHEGFQYKNNRISEARLALLAEFLGACTHDFLPYKAAETVRHISYAPRGPIHPSYQIQLAEGMHNVLALVKSEPRHAELLEELIHSEIFNMYANHVGYAWLKDPEARKTIQGTLKEYASKPSSGPVLTRVEAIVQNLESLHSLQTDPPSSSLHPLQMDPPSSSLHPLQTEPPALSLHPLQTDPPSLSLHPLQTDSPSSSFPLQNNPPSASLHLLQTNPPSTSLHPVQRDSPSSSSSSLPR